MILLALATLWWSTGVLPTFRSAASARVVVDRIVDDQRFKRGALSTILAQIKSGRRPIVANSSLARAQALVGLGFAEEEMRYDGSSQGDREAAAAEESVITSLELNPTDSFLWLLLYSVRITRSGFDKDQLRFIDQSYATGPLEGWIALRRNRLALSAFAMLNDTSQNNVLNEFANLVDSDMTEAAGLILIGTGWPNRDRLLGALKQVDGASKKSLQRWLFVNSVGLAVPGLEHDERPWR
ncbi:hypothetical protein [Bradyrhizobium sp. 174]|uniref:hypothetical protein n=1 Tax=Bradyrhizobium sp. 174 TaxID=2782645 RepID=UPI001FF91784|nr:hypothetical protein [Bradyrhizobium sp. 174]MCK1573661.1 hypothetical protein [Bradyrhizobium sp. 174]